MHLLCSNSLLFTLYSFASLFCIVLAFLLTFFRYARALWRNWVSTRLRELVSGEVGGGWGVHKKVLCGEAPRRTPLTLYTIFDTERYPFPIPSIDIWYPFHIPSLEPCIPMHCFWNMNKSQNLNVFFTFPFMYFN